MAVKITDKQKEVIRKIIYAVETGGQVYGNARYDCFVEAYTGSSIEHAITIGAACWYATNAQNLLKQIRKADSALFSKLDTAGIGSDIDNLNWGTYRVSKTSAKAKCIQNIISSDIGKKVQDKLVDEQMQKYMNDAESLGVTDVAAQMMCANFEHQGGLSAMKRVVAKTPRPYTLDNLYSACQTDVGNQVGAYRQRQKMVYNSLKKYIENASSNSVSSNNNVGGKSMTENELRQLVVNTAKQYLGCKESDGSHRKIIDGYNAHKPLARGYAVTYYDAWCATFVSFISIKLGLTDIMPTECGCGAMIELYRKLGCWQENDAYVPKVGDIIMYYWNDNGIGDCVGYPDHVGIVTGVNGSTITVIEGNNYNAVQYRNIQVNGRFIRGYCLPNYAKKSSNTSTVKTPVVEPKTPATPSSSSTASVSTTKTLNKTSKWVGIVNVENDTLNVRKWAGTNNATCSFSPLKNGTQVDVCDSQKASDGSVWYYIKINGKYGFVHSTYIKKKTVSNNINSSADKQTVQSHTQTSSKVAFAQSMSKAFAGTYKTTADLNIRISAGVNNNINKIITTIPKGKTVTCYGYYTKANGVNWYLVQYNTITGFVASAYLSK